ncbi:MAG: hypothetical protein ACOY3P_11595 [Planctomycetota bacterium]
MNEALALVQSREQHRSRRESEIRVSRRAGAGEEPEFGGGDFASTGKPGRRIFTARYKARILREADACTEPGQIKALLKREGLYSSYLTAWRKQREEGLLEPASAPPDESPASCSQQLIEENRRLQQMNEELQVRLRGAEIKWQVQRRVVEVIKSLLQSVENS